MRSLQEAGIEIFNKTPAKLYVFTGPEIGIKSKYISMLSDIYGGRVLSAPTVSSVISSTQTKRLVPIDPSLYIVRYDKEFVQKLDSSSANKLIECNVSGTIVLVYDSESDHDKLDKFLPKNVVRFDNVSDKLVYKYLASDFQRIPQTMLWNIARRCNDYQRAYNCCSCLNVLSDAELLQARPEDINVLFDLSPDSLESSFKISFANKNSAKILHMLAVSDVSQYESYIYLILSILVELEKAKCNRNVESDLRDFLVKWTLEDIYNMFMQTYNQLNLLRSFTSDSKLSLEYLVSLLGFKSIPAVEELSYVI